MDILERKVGELKEVLSAEAAEEVVALERLNYRLSDAIREGCKVSTKAHGWTDGEESMCALSAAVTAAKARGFI